MIHPGAQIGVHAPTVAAVTVIKHENQMRQWHPREVTAMAVAEASEGNGERREIGIREYCGRCVAVENLMKNFELC